MVLEAAWRVVATRGLERTRYGDIARESDTPVSTLQNAFGTLQALLNAAIDHAAAKDAAFLATVPDRGAGSAWERIEALILGAVGEAYGFESWLVWVELWRAAARDAVIAEHTSATYELWWDAAEAIIADGQAAGDFTTDVAARDLAIATIAVLDGCALSLLLKAERPDPADAARIILATLSRTLRA